MKPTSILPKNLFTGQEKTGNRSLPKAVELEVVKDRNTKVLNAVRFVDDVMLIKMQDGSKKDAGATVESRDYYLSKLPVEAIVSTPDYSIAEEQSNQNNGITAAKEAIDNAFADDLQDAA